MQSIVLFSGLALKDVLEDSLIPPFIERTGIAVERVYEPTTVLADLIHAGGRPDVIIGVSAALREMGTEGHVRAESIRGLVRSNVGVAIAQGRPHEPLETTQDLEALLRAASSIAYSSAGASGGVFRRVLSEMDLTDLVASKSVVLPKGFTAEAVRDGRAEIAIQQISELAAVPDVDIIGPLPAELGAYVELSIAVGADGQNPDLASSLVEHLGSPENGPVYQRGFLQQVL